MKITRWLTLLICFVLCGPSNAQDAKPADEALLEDLGADLLNPSDDTTPSALDGRLMEELGEDLNAEQDRKNDWLARVITHMKTAEGLLEQREQASRASSAQAEAIVGLDAMIAELTERQSQCKGGNCQKPGSPKPGQKPKPNGKAGKNPSQDAPTTTNADADLSTELAVAGELVKDLWGKLPERQRQQILQPLSEEFLPKYASEIEAYFRALAQPKKGPVQSR